MYLKHSRTTWMAGFQILNADDSDIDTWVVMIAIVER